MPLVSIATLKAASPDHRSDVLVSWWEEMKRRMADKRELLVHLSIILAGKERNFDMFEIGMRDVSEAVVLTEQRHVTVHDLTDWLGDVFGRVHNEAARHNARDGAALAIYHEEVNEESDGPVEVCLPIRASASDQVTMATRVESAHREADTRIRKSQVEFPQILDAYDAVEQWVAKNNRKIAGSPREVYFADFMNAGPDDEVVDIAFPIE